ncbi:hypothetical protein TIFTF001_018763 [Ficus carica]|uniref:Uncharacterized protein n=1 Tax=Ficus carica TaxID=3494 RepID=A0AA88AVX1_FICCA|nr:hypothetical protein TIFTF001_018763 [Ficus carica]
MMGFKEEIGGRSRCGEWRREKKGEARERIRGGVAAGGAERRRRKGEAEREWRRGRRENGRRGHGGGDGF